MCTGGGGFYTNDPSSTSKMPQGYSSRGLDQFGDDIYGLSDEYGERVSTYESNKRRAEQNDPSNVTYRRVHFVQGNTGKLVEKSDSLKIQKADRISRAHADSRNIPYSLWSGNKIVNPGLGFGGIKKDPSTGTLTKDQLPKDVILDKSGQFYTSKGPLSKPTSKAFAPSGKRKSGGSYTAYIPSNYRTLGPTGVPTPPKSKKELRIGHEGIWTPPPTGGGGSSGINF